jgi:hypothetical protein
MACSTHMYKYKDAVFDSPERAIAVQQADHGVILNKITPTENHIGGSALIILPSENLIEKNGLIKLTSGNVHAEGIRYLVVSTKNEHDLMAESIKKRRIFDTVAVINSDDPEKQTFSEDIGIYLTYPRQGKAEWFLKRKKDQPIQPVPIYVNNSLGISEIRIIAWLDNIEKVSKADQKSALVDPLASLLGSSNMVISSSSLYVKENDNVFEIEPVIPENYLSMRKQQHNIKGKKSMTRLHSKKPVFYTKVNPSSFILIKLLYDEDKDIRYAVGKMKFYKNNLPIRFTEKSYDFFELFSEEELSPGEYAFISTIITPLGTKSATAFYDFGIE